MIDTPARSNAYAEIHSAKQSERRLNRNLSFSDSSMLPPRPPVPPPPPPPKEPPPPLLDASTKNQLIATSGVSRKYDMNALREELIRHLVSIGKFKGRLRGEEGKNYSSRRRKRGHPMNITLSTVYSQNPTLFDTSKISATGKGITSLDALPSRFHGVTTLYLSNNNITSLRGIEQFRNAKIVSLSGNQVTKKHPPFFPSLHHSAFKKSTRNSRHLISKTPPRELTN
jgi:hypothetical protein